MSSTTATQTPLSLCAPHFPAKGTPKQTLRAKGRRRPPMAAQLSEYEQTRLRNIAENNARLAHIGLLDDALACRTQRRTLSAEELARRSAAGAARHEARLANRRPSSRRLELLAASDSKRAAAAATRLVELDATRARYWTRRAEGLSNGT